jgi:hypothetical protein
MQERQLSPEPVLTPELVAVVPVPVQSVSAAPMPPQQTAVSVVLATHL